MAQSLSATIITSGLLGIFYYGEGGGTACTVVGFLSGTQYCAVNSTAWCETDAVMFTAPTAAIWTLLAMILLGLEKQEDVATPDGGGIHAGSGSGSAAIADIQW